MKTKTKTIKITKQWLQEQGACSDGIAWFEKQKVVSLPSLMKKALTQRQFNFANWGLVRLMTQQQQVQYACFSALQSIHEFEKMFPNDKRPREAILAALRWALDPSKLNKSAAGSARSAAWSAAWSAARSARFAAWSAARSAAGSAAESAAWSAESAARSARSAAESAAWSARSAARSARSAAGSAAESARSAAESAAWKKLLLYGLKVVLKQAIIKSIDYLEVK